MHRTLQDTNFWYSSMYTLMFPRPYLRPDLHKFIPLSVIYCFFLAEPAETFAHYVPSNVELHTLVMRHVFPKKVSGAVGSAIPPMARVCNCVLLIRRSELRISGQLF